MYEYYGYNFHEVIVLNSLELSLIATTVIIIGARWSCRVTSNGQTERMGAHTRVRIEDPPKLSRGIGPEFISRYIRDRSASATKLYDRGSCTSPPIPLSVCLSLTLSTAFPFSVFRFHPSSSHSPLSLSFSERLCFCAYLPSL